MKQISMENIQSAELMHLLKGCIIKTCTDSAFLLDDKGKFMLERRPYNSMSSIENNSQKLNPFHHSFNAELLDNPQKIICTRRGVVFALVTHKNLTIAMMCMTKPSLFSCSGKSNNSGQESTLDFISRSFLSHKRNKQERATVFFIASQTISEVSRCKFILTLS